MRDHRNLRAFQLADALVIDLYRATKTFPRDEMFGLPDRLVETSKVLAALIRSRRKPNS